MHRAGLGRLGLVATLATGAAMLAGAVHGMTDLDGELRLAAARSGAQPVFVADRRPPPQAADDGLVWRPEHVCDGPHRPHPRV